MASPRLVSKGRLSTACGLAAVIGLAAIGLVASGERRVHAAAQGSIVTTSPVYWMWDPSTVIGTSRLVRTGSGLSAVLHASGVPKGHAMTLWFAVFNNPEACGTSPCTLADAGNAEVRVDFLWGGGAVTGGSGKVHLAGHVKAGDPSGSVFIEFGNPGAAIGVIDPRTADVMLLVHSHGPAVPGQVLKSQLSSFLGGCSVFLGPDGFAAAPEDIPLAVGECSTFQVSVHP